MRNRPVDMSGAIVRLAPPVAIPATRPALPMQPLAALPSVGRAVPVIQRHLNGPAFPPPALGTRPAPQMSPPVVPRNRHPTIPSTPVLEGRFPGSPAAVQPRPAFPSAIWPHVPASVTQPSYPYTVNQTMPKRFSRKADEDNRLVIVRSPIDVSKAKRRNEKKGFTTTTISGPANHLFKQLIKINNKNRFEGSHFAPDSGGGPTSARNLMNLPHKVNTGRQKKFEGRMIRLARKKNRRMGIHVVAKYPVKTHTGIIKAAKMKTLKGRLSTAEFKTFRRILASIPQEIFLAGLDQGNIVDSEHIKNIRSKVPSIKGISINKLVGAIKKTHTQKRASVNKFSLSPHFDFS